VADAPVAVMLRSTADTSFTGTPATPATCTSIVSFAPTLNERRVSSSRTGALGLYRPSIGDVPSSYQPTTSVSPNALASWIEPSAPSLTVARSATVSPADTFRFETAGNGSPLGATVT
jgi:hypothetical protein